MKQNEALEQLFTALWDRYRRQNPQVNAILSLLSTRENASDIVNDHIALRTFDDPRVDIAVLARPFLACGYQEKESYHLTEKHVFAKYFSHPSGQFPRVFISQLQMNQLSKQANDLIAMLIEQIKPEHIDVLCTQGRLWQSTSQVYQTLLTESEYAAWMCVHGFAMNHATISVNHLKTFPGIEAFIEFLQSHQFKFNGEKEQHILQIARDQRAEIVLKQASTLADQVLVDFSDQSMKVPSCYFEFIERFKQYDGFDPGNATKIMESTHVRK